MLEQVQIKRHASVQRKKKGLKHFTRNLSSHRPLTFSTPIIQTSFRIIVSAGRNHYPPSVKFTRFPPSSTKHDKRNKIGLSTPSVVRIARSSKKLAPIPGGEPPQPSLPPPSELPRQILHNYRGERGTFFLLSLESWPRLETLSFHPFQPALAKSIGRNMHDIV